MKNTKPLFLFLKDLFGWYWSPMVIRFHVYGDGVGMKELWCSHFGHNYYTHKFKNLRVRGKNSTCVYGITVMRICKRCGNPSETLYAQTIPLVIPVLS